ncbi:MAG: hypothetical protein UU77_C0013G0010 [candidate division WWE3 bacterium GW2011_GWC1_41_7]|uniref:Uncharacterized protein n=4 Tax=Katanobacteria TaxID=422282 RepID=A0A0G0X7H3_UNCKA|nr:MAG: hypothetical protein UU72_C0019G0010 [candidate division WWE3 bacterium GW2011_GWB1_41_6]KKS20895.1 MAG: hypothetical protein UU77_C0013G0010 [candidate division WWE3 bacterium GW2011_GWC1_41_7]KKS21876.1 MAG: hypothetical protein UU80_C0018G0012 [candidate division WWE3 bacterium GW2011_GWA1_41_8]OGC57904.1 MAG: hypothetical protein A2976_00335 [candidate division WWE3 bacterium RIFCSPLOWO2_01_FULL_41_9]
MTDDIVDASFKWARQLAARNGFVEGCTVSSPEGLIYEIVSIGFGADEACVTLQLSGQPKAISRTVIIRERQAEISWGGQHF